MNSVAKYFKHFPILEIDFTLYRPLKDQNGKSTPIFQILKAYQQHLQEGDALILKVPQVITIPRPRRGYQYHRFTHTCMGKTAICRSSIKRSAVHPHVRGDNLARKRGWS